MAAENGHEQVADVLLWHKAFVNAKSKLGLTPLHLAAQNGYNDLVRLLIETHSAVIDALSLVRTHQYYEHEYANQQITIISSPSVFLITQFFLQAKQTPLHMAAQCGKMEVCNTLLKMRADANATDVVCTTDFFLIRSTVR